MYNQAGQQKCCNLHILYMSTSSLIFHLYSQLNEPSTSFLLQSLWPYMYIKKKKKFHASDALFFISIFIWNDQSRIFESKEWLRTRKHFELNGQEGLYCLKCNCLKLGNVLFNGGGIRSCNNFSSFNWKGFAVLLCSFRSWKINIRLIFEKNKIK